MPAANQNEATVEGRQVQLALGGDSTLLQQLRDLAGKEFVFLIPDGDGRAIMVTDGTPVSDAIGKEVHAVVAAGAHKTLAKEVDDLKKNLKALQDQFTAIKDKALTVENLTITGKIIAQELKVHGATEFQDSVKVTHGEHGLNVSGPLVCNGVTCNGNVVVQEGATLQVKGQLTVEGERGKANIKALDVGKIAQTGYNDATAELRGLTIRETGIKVERGLVEVQNDGITVKEGGLEVKAGLLRARDGIKATSTLTRDRPGVEISNGLVSSDGNVVVQEGATLQVKGQLTVEGERGKANIKALNVGKIAQTGYNDASAELRGLTVKETGIKVEKGGVEVEKGGVVVQDGRLLAKNGITVEKDGLEVKAGPLFANHGIHTTSIMSSGGAVLGDSVNIRNFRFKAVDDFTLHLEHNNGDTNMVRFSLHHPDRIRIYNNHGNFFFFNHDSRFGVGMKGGAVHYGKT
ncbi:hypothetical protein DFJ74DRAFT_474697 [Hyaloraphidium curvatum]|nr:hypothetical protein DFJ74DRAFT_474697 [Hyaloraphidium curvatum]